MSTEDDSTNNELFWGQLNEKEYIELRNKVNEGKKKIADGLGTGPEDRDIPLVTDGLKILKPPGGSKEDSPEKKLRHSIKPIITKRSKYRKEAREQWGQSQSIQAALNKGIMQFSKDLLSWLKRIKPNGMINADAQTIKTCLMEYNALQKVKGYAEFSSKEDINDFNKLIEKIEAIGTVIQLEQAINKTAHDLTDFQITKDTESNSLGLAALSEKINTIQGKVDSLENKSDSIHLQSKVDILLDKFSQRSGEANALALSEDERSRDSARTPSPGGSKRES